MNKRWLTAATTFGAASLVFGAAALAQVQTPMVGTFQATTATTTETVVGGTASAIATGTIVSGTVSPGSTETSGIGTVSPGTTGTAVSTAVGTSVVVPTIPVPTSVYVAGGTGKFPFASPDFQRVWERTDRLLNEGKVKRTYFWGPGPNSVGLSEAYAEAPGGGGLRLVQYFDKSRMEINNPGGNRNDPFFVTNGLLTVELISGRIQVGNNTFANFHPACIPMSGDFGDTQAPTYQAFAKVSSVESGNNPSADRRGQKIMETIDRNGNTGTDASKGTDPKVEITAFFTETKHNVPKVFLDFLNQVGPVYNTNGSVSNARLIDPLTFVTGLPISEAFWAKATIQGQTRDVLIQAFQRRALTYVPTNDPSFQVEMANIGQHYFDWRYRNAGYCSGQTPSTPTAPVPAPTSGTVVPSTGTVQVTGTVRATGTGTVRPGLTTTPNPTFTRQPGLTTTPNPSFTAPVQGSPPPTQKVGPPPPETATITR